MGTVTVYSPTGEPLNFPDTMTEAEISDVMRAQFPPTQSAYKPAPEGYKVIKDFEDGSYILEGSDSNPYFYDVNAGYGTNDLATIAEIAGERGAKGSVGRKRAGERFAGEAAQDIVGEKSTRLLSLGKGIPFVRDAILPAGAALRSAVQGDDFATNLETLNAAVDRRAQEAPKTAMASQLAAGMAISAPFALRQAAMSRGGKAAEGALQGGVVGGAEGAVSGFFKGAFEDPSRSLMDMLGAGYEEGLNQGQSGVKIGAGIGAVAPSIGEAAGGLYSRYLKQPIRDIVERIGFKDDAARVVQDTLAMDAAGAVESATSAGPYGSISTLGPNTQALLDVVANSPSKGARIARDNLKETSSIAARDLTDTLDNALGTPRKNEGLLTQQRDIMKDTAEGRRELYDKAYDFELSADTEGGAEVIDLLSRVDSADMSSARTLLKEGKEQYSFLGGERLTQSQLNEIPVAQRQGLSVTSAGDGMYDVSRVPTVASVDYITRQLYDQSEALMRAGNAAASASKRNLAMLLRTSLDKVNPDYAAARAAGQDAIDLRAAAQLGTDILSTKVSPEDVVLALQSVDKVGAKHLRQALRNQIDKEAAKAKVNPRGDNDQEVVEAIATLKSMNTRFVKEKLELALGEEITGRIGQQINDTSSALMQHASVALGSKTAVRGMVVERMKEIVGESLGEKVGRQGLLSTAGEAATDAVVGTPKQAQRIREVSGEIAPVLTQRKTPQQLQEEARQMQNMTTILDMANNRGRSLSNMVRGGSTGVTTQQVSQGPTSEAERRMQMLSLGTYGR